jgi:protein-disulfide isomerase
MANKSSGKLAMFLIVALVGGTAGYTMFKQNTATTPNALTDAAPASTPADAAKAKPEADEALKVKDVIDASLITPKPNDIILGDNNAVVTMVEYSSLTCPHCAHFHNSVLPTLQKNFIDTGKVKLVIRHYPLNEPAIKASQVVECAGQNGLKRENFLKVLFEMQDKWAFAESYLNDLKKIALVGGLDSAAFDSCVNDKAIETKILSMRQVGESKLHITSTPSFFIDGVKYQGTPSVDDMSAALTAAAKAK